MVTYRVQSWCSNIAGKSEGYVSANSPLGAACQVAESYYRNATVDDSAAVTHHSTSGDFIHFTGKAYNETISIDVYVPS